jgi:hypothetical protein
MREPQDPHPVDVAYNVATQQQTDAAASARRRAAVLAAVAAAAPPVPAQAFDQSLDAVVKRDAANQPSWWQGGYAWRGAVAASVMVFSTVLVLRVKDEPAAVMGAVDRASEAVVPAAPPATEPAFKAPSPAAIAPAVAPAAPPVADADKAVADSSVVARRAASPQRQAPMVASPARGQTPSPAATAAPAEALAQAPALPPSPPAAPVLSESSGLPALAASPAAKMAQAQVPLPRAQSAAPEAMSDSALELRARAAPVAAAPSSIAPPSVASTTRAKLAPAPSTTSPDANKDADGRTALALAVLRADAAAVSALIARGANPLLADRFGQTAMDYAQALADPAVLAALKR